MSTQIKKATAKKAAANKAAANKAAANKTAKTTKPSVTRSGRWHPSQETDELIFSVCDRYFYQLGLASHAGGEESDSQKEKAAKE